MEEDRLREERRGLLVGTQRALRSQIEWLEHSLQITESAASYEDLSCWQPTDYDAMEALSSRFARALDYLVRKALRLIDSIEYESQGSLLDVVHRAEKRGIIADIEALERMRDLRNRIAHEYAEEDLAVLFWDVRKLTPKLLVLLQSANSYIVEKFLEGIEDT